MGELNLRARKHRSASRASRATVMLDAVVALFMASIAFAAVFSGIAIAARTARVVRARLVELIEVENRDATNTIALFTTEPILE